MIEFKVKHHDELRHFSSIPIQDEVITITYEHPSSEVYSERKFQANISPSGKSLKKYIKIEFKVKYQIEPNKFSSEHIENSVLIITSETSYAEYCLKIKVHAKFDKSDKISEQLEE